MLLVFLSPWNVEFCGITIFGFILVILFVRVIPYFVIPYFMCYREAVETLLRFEACANMSDNKGCHPLHLAAFNGHAEICKMLLVHGPSYANVNEQVSNLYHFIKQDFNFRWLGGFFFQIQGKDKSISVLLFAKGMERLGIPSPPLFLFWILFPALATFLSWYPLTSGVVWSIRGTFSALKLLVSFVYSDHNFPLSSLLTEIVELPLFLILL